MKRLLLHIALAACAAAAGWYFGQPVMPAAKVEKRKTAAVTIAANIAGRDTQTWAAQLPAVRRMPPSASEPAWIKWGMSVPDAAIPAAIARLNPATDFHALRYLYARWVKLDPAAAWASFRNSDIPGEVLHFYLPDGRETSGMSGSRLQSNPRELIASRMLASWATVDAAAAKAFAAKLADKGTPEAKDLPVNSYYLREALGGEPSQPSLPPEQAAVAALTQPAGEERSCAIAEAAQRWAKTDASAVCAWLRSLPLDDRTELWRFGSMPDLKGAPHADRVPALTALLEARGLPSESLAASQTRRGHDHFHEDLRGTAAAVREWMATDATAARTWLTAQPEGDLKSLLAGEAAAALVRTDVNAAVALLNNTGGDQTFAVRAFVNGWAETDARAALEWAGKIDDAPLRDTSRTTAALQLAGTDPALALETARTVTDPAQRQRVFEAVKQSLSWNPAALGVLQEKFPGDDWNAARR